MKLVIDVVEGCEGNSLSIGNENDKGSGTGRRIAGPKPWGGGRTIDKFEIDASDVKSILKEAFYVYPEQIKEVCKEFLDEHKEEI